MRLGSIIAHLLSNEEELVSILFGNSSLLNVDEDELAAIKEVLTQEPKVYLPKGELK